MTSTTRSPRPRSGRTGDRIGKRWGRSTRRWGGRQRSRGELSPRPRPISARPGAITWASSSGSRILISTLSCATGRSRFTAGRYPISIRPNWETVITPVLDQLERLQPGVDQRRIGLMGISMGAIYGPRAAAHDKRLRAVVGLAGPYNLGECWDALNPLTKGGYIFYTKSAGEAEAKQKAYTFNLEGVLDRVTQPLLVIHGGRDRLFPPAQAERIAREAPAATLVIYRSE